MAFLSLDMMEETFQIQLPEAEAAFVAMHIVNSKAEDSTMDETFRITKIIQDVLNIVGRSFAVEFDTGSSYYYPNQQSVDFYHRYKKDIALLSEMGFNIFRMSISWFRLFPKGIEDEPNREGLEFYRNVFLELKKHGIEPLVTISHYDTPLYIEEELGGWSNRRVIELFDRYTETIFEEYKGLVKYWLTFNEINITIMVADLIPDLPNETKAQNLQVLHNQFVASTRAVKRAHSIDPGYKVGCMISAPCKYPLTCDSKDMLETQQGWQTGSYYCGDVMVRGKYPAFAPRIWKNAALSWNGAQKIKPI